MPLCVNEKVTQDVTYKGNFHIFYPIGKQCLIKFKNWIPDQVLGDKGMIKLTQKMEVFLLLKIWYRKNAGMVKKELTMASSL